jgi:hypothetical protein
MRLAMLCPIARPVESTTSALNAAVNRRDVDVWARTVSPLSTSFRIPAAAGPLTPVGCSAGPGVLNISGVKTYSATSHDIGVWHQPSCHDPRPAALTAPPRSTPPTSCFGVRNGISRKDRS